MGNVVQLKRTLWAWLFTIWCSTAWAAQATFANDISQIPLAAIQWTVVLSLLGGLGYTLQKIAAPAVVLKNLWLEMLKDILLALLAGLITFFFVAWLKFPSLLQAALITLAGYGGSRVIEKYLSKGLSQIDNFGTPTKKEEAP